MYITMNSEGVVIPHAHTQSLATEMLLRVCTHITGLIVLKQREKSNFALSWNSFQDILFRAHYHHHICHMTSRPHLPGSTQVQFHLAIEDIGGSHTTEEEVNQLLWREGTYTYMYVRKCTCTQQNQGTCMHGI